MSQFDTVLAEAQQKWMDLDGVIAVGEGNSEGKSCIFVLISKPLHQLNQQIPRTYQGINVIIKDAGGTVQAYTDDQ